MTERAREVLDAGAERVIIGSALTIAGAVYCLSFTRTPYFQTLGIPSAIGVLVSLAASLTLAPAVSPNWTANAVLAGVGLACYMAGSFIFAQRDLEVE